MHILTVDIEVHEGDQARYLAHGTSDLCWTDKIEEALEFLRNQIEEE